MKPVEPIDTIDLFPPLSWKLLDLLQRLRPADWARPTACDPWSVKDVAAHLLGGNLGRLWKRDQSPASSGKPPRDFDNLVRAIDRDNELWVQAAERISPEMLVELLELTDRRLYDHFKNLPQHEPARISVAWAGDKRSPNWFDIAREYTEKWLHQQHIREAVGKPLLMGREWLFPVLDTFMRGLPYTYHKFLASNGTSISVQVAGKAGGEWSLVRERSQWKLFEGRDALAGSRVCIDQDLAWRLFTRGVTWEEARPQVQIEGDVALGEHVLRMVSIMA